MTLHRRSLLHFAGGAALAPSIARGEPRQIRMGIQYGVTYLPIAVMQNQGLIEKHAKAAGLGEVQAVWTR